MKNIFKLSTLALVLGLSVTGNAVAVIGEDQATGVFQWSGTLPSENVDGTSVKIVNPGPLKHDEGTLTFAINANEGYDLTSSSELVFEVHKGTGAAPTTWTAATSFDYEVQHLQFSAGLGPVKTGTDEFHIKANAVAIPSTGKAGANGLQRLTVGADAPLKGTGFTDGAAVVVQATILVSNAV